MAGIWILAENREEIMELLNKGRELAQVLKQNLGVFTASREAADEYIAAGADEVFLLPQLPEGEIFNAYMEGIAQQALESKPEAILIAGTLRGKEMAARLAQRLKTGLCSQCINISLNNDTGQLEMERLIYGGAAVQTVVCTSTPCIATIPPRTFEPASCLEGRSGQITEMHFNPVSPVKVIEHCPAESREENLSEARVIVCAGRGIENEADMEMVRQLARAVSGNVGCTRPLAEELHWLPEDTCIGLSGCQVKPDLYIGIGVSGQIQHTTGIRDSKVILAINRDENAPIFEAADFGIVGDLYEVVPLLITALEKRTGQK